MKRILLQNSPPAITIPFALADRIAGLGCGLPLIGRKFLEPADEMRGQAFEEVAEGCPEVEAGAAGGCLSCQIASTQPIALAIPLVAPFCRPVVYASRLNRPAPRPSLVIYAGILDIPIHVNWKWRGVGIAVYRGLCHR